MKFKLKPTLDDLRKECEDHGLPIDGTFKEIKERLKKHADEPKEDLFRNPDVKGTDQKAYFNLAEDKFFLQLKLANLSMYFVHGLIYPANLEQSIIYKEQNRKADLLTQFPDHLPIAKGVINDFDETQVLIEILLTTEEINHTPTIADIYYFKGPLPISRVSGIYFANNSVRTSFLASVDVFPDAFVPKGICEIIPEQIETKKLPESKITPESLHRWNNVIDKYDRLLGLIAFLKNTSLFYTNLTAEYLEYTPGYFQALSLINAQADNHSKENSFFRWIVSPDSIEIDGKLARFQFKEIIKTVYENREFDIDWGLQLLENCMAFEQNQESIEQLRFIAKLFFDYKKLRTDYRTILASPLVQKNIPIIILVFLIKFPNRGLGHSDKQAFKNYFRSNESGIERKDAEYIFAVMGLYYGYSNLVKEDRIEISDPYFNVLARENAQIKFKLDTFLDRFTIESVFEYSKSNGGRLTKSFDFLNVVKSAPQIRLAPPRNNEAEYIDQSFSKYDKKILNIKRIGANIILSRDITNFYGDQITQAEHMFIYISRHYPELLTVKTEKLAQLIAENPGNKNLSELRDTIELDKKYGKTKSFRR